MTLPDWAALAPAGTLAAAALVVLVLDIVDPDAGADADWAFAGVTATGGLGALGFTAWYLLAGTGQPDSGGPIELFESNLVVDGMALFFTAIVASVVVLVALASYDYLEGRSEQATYYSLTLLAATGMALVAMANSFVVAFISIELISLPSYALVASLKTNRGSTEAGLKYFLVGALSSAIFAYGISLVYVSTGALGFPEVADALAENPDPGILGLGILFVLGGLAFKMAVVPFHFWAPEAYEGAPAPVAAFLSSASKAAGFVVTFRVFVAAFPIGDLGGVLDWVVAVQILAVVTMTVGNLAALRQENVKRMLAYSSIGHAGFALIGLAASTQGGAFALGSGMVHLLVYGFMNTGAFLVVALAEYWDLGRRIEDYNGLATQAPFVAAAMTVFLYSLAGLPLGGGFLSKFYLLWASIRGEVAILAVALVLNSAVSVFYYTRVVKAMWTESPDPDLELTEYPTGLYAAIALALLVTVLLLPGFGVLVDFAETAARAL